MNDFVNPWPEANTAPVAPKFANASLFVGLAGVLACVVCAIGEQAVLSKEIWWEGTTAANAADEGVFGYQERYAEYRYKPSRISGLFRSNAATTVEFWHLSEDFAARPTLGQTFIEDQTESILDTRVFVPAEPDFYGDFWFDYKWARPMPVFGVPGWTDHF